MKYSLKMSCMQNNTSVNIFKLNKSILILYFVVSMITFLHYKYHVAKVLLCQEGRIIVLLIGLSQVLELNIFSLFFLYPPGTSLR